MSQESPVYDGQSEFESLIRQRIALLDQAQAHFGSDIRAAEVRRRLEQPSELAALGDQKGLELARAYASNEERCLDEVVKLIEKLVKAGFMRRLRTPTVQTLDVINSVWQKLWKPDSAYESNWDFTTESEVVGWTTTTVRNLLMDRWRARGGKGRLRQVGASSDEQDELGTIPLTRLLYDLVSSKGEAKSSSALTLQDLEHQFDQWRQRGGEWPLMAEVLIERHGVGTSPKEIALGLEMEVESVYVLIRRALEAIRKELGL